jgi:prepilin-type N-terminal cleavage/methylation domain-containing protein
MLKGRLHKAQRGDTIIEVMIVLAVLGLAIGIAYATANRSLLNARQAQENSQATAAAQAQVELLVSIGCTSGNPNCDLNDPLNPGYGLLHPPGGGPFCIVPSTDPTQPPQVEPSTDPNCSKQAPLPGSAVEIRCIASCSTPPPPARAFEVTIRWDDALSQGQDTVTQDYTLPQ